VRICVLGSGSAGNSALVSTDSVSVLVDLGFGVRSLDRRLEEAGILQRHIQAVFLTHGHCDHVRGMRSLLKRFPKLRVFLTAGTLDETPALQSHDRLEIIQAGCEVQLGDLVVKPFAIPHDAAESVGFRFEAGGLAGALVTDLGHLDGSVTGRLRDCDWIVLESNHDEELLRIGPYPWPLKQRLLSQVGHLSNAAVARFLERDFDGRARHLFLAHLSRQNNRPEIALDCALRALNGRAASTNGGCAIHLTDQRKPSIVVQL